MESYIEDHPRVEKILYVGKNRFIPIVKELLYKYQDLCYIDTPYFSSSLFYREGSLPEMQITLRFSFFNGSLCVFTYDMGGMCLKDFSFQLSEEILISSIERLNKRGITLTLVDETDCPDGCVSPIVTQHINKITKDDNSYVKSIKGNFLVIKYILLGN